MAAIDIVLAPAKENPQKAGALLLSVYFMNQGDEAATLAVPQTIACSLELDAPAYTTTMEAVSSVSKAPSTLPPHGVYRQDYTIALPEGKSGTARITPKDLDTREILVAVAPEVEKKHTPITQSEEVAAVKKEDVEVEEGEEVTPLSYVVENLATYKPMYFLYGGDPTVSKFQLSFKYRLFNPNGDWAKSLPWLSGFHIAYTQTSLWDMESISKPFKDSSYMPEVFWSTYDLGFEYPNWLDTLGFSTGLQHESNGKGGSDSRSLNIAYVEPLVRFALPWDFYFTIAPKVWTYVWDLSDNPDIADYRGHFDLRFTLGQQDGIQLTTNLRKGNASGKGSVQLDLTYPLSKLTNDNLGLYLQAQFFDGYAESLIDYDQRETSIRFGVGLSRW